MIWVHPKEWFITKAKIGGTKKLNFDKIKALEPDLIIGNKEENDRDQIEKLMELYPVWMSDINTLKDQVEHLTLSNVILAGRILQLESTPFINYDAVHAYAEEHKIDTSTAFTAIINNLIE